MRAIFILVFTAVQANALAPRGLATPPGITQSVRRVVRRLGRKMVTSIRTRLANEDPADGAAADGGSGQGDHFLYCCVEKDGEVYKIITSTNGNCVASDKPLLTSVSCDKAREALEEKIPEPVKSYVNLDAVLEEYIDVKTNTAGLKDDSHSMALAYKNAVEAAIDKKKLELETRLASLKAEHDAAKETKVHAQADLDKMKEEITKITEDKTNAQAEIEQISKDSSRKSA
eukprot:CAMPEP_0179220506 /NCGR_PEP_ID=MMETSP0797-20121207/5657_1 /TAXON_ID=47934 /ORGANISM="Dinophysis acuminata, Strain DAEP01" /LENGTH=229 /DNA_ID=CAMNT_0020927153 /DNA_START=100 /DNA_END=789 /DNA_ORIENTATION=+